ncbi:hypothetical protein N7492_009520 [Penicillium capsulatum]|uniref:Uncharacterized protein n=1 Tax=Penicillium capsulatum TaxID=69766 RepID=A0A9W9LI60_9EURO|nr:hypothetical protein N7492_009520 [Penicillium capsulatum]KAJ6106910.1 hypothetical protein N7512_010427 [Penicillium capsulatum]
MPSRSASPFRSAENLGRMLNLRDENRDEDEQLTGKPDHSRVTSRGAPARHSRRQRSEYASWNRASDQPTLGPDSRLDPDGVMFGDLYATPGYIHQKIERANGALITR